MSGEFDSFVSQMAMEGYLFDDKTLEFNLELWAPGDHNILFITGLSGSGKTTMAERLEKERGAKMFELDGIDYGYDSSGAGLLDQLIKESPEYAKIIRDNPQGTRMTQLPVKDDLYRDLFEKLIGIMATDPKTLYIIEGIQIFSFANESVYDEPLIILGASVTKALFRRLRREGNGKIRWSRALSNEFLNLCGFYINCEKELKRFKRLRKR